MLKDKVAIVTGGARGIGAGISECLVASGAKVAIVDLDGDAAQELAKRLNGSAAGFAADVSQESEMQAVSERIAAHFGGLDILVNNAGGGRPGVGLGNPFTRISQDDWDEQVVVNLRTAFAASKAAIPLLQQRGGGSIVNIASIAGRQGQPRMGAYVATKWAVIGLTRQLALEYAPTIRVNCVAPGTVDTDEMDKTFARRDALAGTESGTAKAKRVAALPLQRQGQPEDIGRAVAYLASDAADWVTGQTINVDGGQVMN